MSDDAIIQKGTVTEVGPAGFTSVQVHGAYMRPFLDAQDKEKSDGKGKDSAPSGFAGSTANQQRVLDESRVHQEQKALQTSLTRVFQILKNQGLLPQGVVKEVVEVSQFAHDTLRANAARLSKEISVSPRLLADLTEKAIQRGEEVDRLKAHIAELEAREPAREEGAACLDIPILTVTDEMVAAARAAHLARAAGSSFADWATDTYRAMAALAPCEIEDITTALIPWKAALAKSRNEVRVAERLGLDVAKESSLRIKELEADNLTLKRQIDLQARIAGTLGEKIAELESQNHMLMSDKANHDYLGPVKDGKAAPDPVHERVHEVVGDILGGRVIRPARDQMEKALADARTKDDKAPKSIRGITTSGDPRRIGWP